jgi:cobyrinic acid a,c-diamide synthase
VGDLADIPRLVIAAPSSGAGKTTVAVAIMAHLRRRGLRVQGWKAGPDFIDPGFHTLACGRPGRNLDGWMLGHDACLELFARQPADIAVIEGVMGLFDGRAGAGGPGSAAELARWLEAPVLLVVDAGAASGSVAATAWGFATYDPAVRVAGVVVNRVAGPSHAAAIRESMRQPLWGMLPRDDRIAAPERHLGLVPAPERGRAWVDALADWIGPLLDWDAVLAAARSAPPLSPVVPVLFAGEPARVRTRIAVARDESLHFYYEDGLDLLRQDGAQLLFWSPLRDTPPAADAMYFGGGFPEMFYEQLSANTPALEAVRRFRGPIYAECGGLIYLARAGTDLQGRRFPLAGVIPGETVMTERLAGFGYREAEPGPGNPLARGTVRGHEFHHSRAEGMGASPAWWMAGRADGYADGRVVAGYLHVHMAGAPELAERLVSWPGR